MKKITLFITLLTFSLGFAHNLTNDFETSPVTEEFIALDGGLLTNGDFENGSDSWLVGVDDNTSAPVVTVGGNTYYSVDVAAAGNAYDVNLSQKVEIIEGSSYTLTFDAWSNVDRTILAGIGLSKDPWSNTAESVSITATRTTYTLTHTATFGATDARVLFDLGAEIGTVNIDDVSLIIVTGNTGGGGGTTPADPEPTDAPATPPSYDANKVVSIYSEAFTASATIANVDWDEGAAFEEVTIADNKVLKVTGPNFIGIDLGTYIDASTMTHLHMDFWIATDYSEGQVLNPKLSNHAAQSGETSAIDISNPINSQDEVKNWQSKDFTLNGDRQSIKEFLITHSGKSNVYYLDNVYMYIEGTASLNKNNILNLSLYPNPSTSRLTISAPNTIKSAAIYNILGKQVMSLEINKNSESIDVSNLATGMYLIKYSIDNAVGTAKFIKQ